MQKTQLVWLGHSFFKIISSSGKIILIDPWKQFPPGNALFPDGYAINDADLILVTHGHFDHLMGNGFVEKTWGLKSEIHKEDNYLVEQASTQSLLFGMSIPKPPLPGSFFEDGDILTFGNSSLKVIFVPGHSPGGVAFYSEPDQLLIAGDILFCGSVGRTDLPKGNHDLLITGILDKLMVLDPAVKVYSGHGPETTIGAEKQFNQFLN